MQPKRTKFPSFYKFQQESIGRNIPLYKYTTVMQLLKNMLFYFPACAPSGVFSPTFSLSLLLSSCFTESVLASILSLCSPGDSSVNEATVPALLELELFEGVNDELGETLTAVLFPCKLLLLAESLVGLAILLTQLLTLCGVNGFGLLASSSGFPCTSVLVL